MVKKMTIETHTVCKNSIEFLEMCLKQVLPYIDIARVDCDIASTDGTKEMLERMAEENSKIKLRFYECLNLDVDLIKVRNRQLQDATSDWICCLDDDEYYTDSDIKAILEILKSSDDIDVYLLRSWFIVSKEHYVKRRSKITVEKFFRNKGFQWKPLKFGAENLWDGDKMLKRDTPQIYGLLPYYFIHLSYFKKSSWRNEWGKYSYSNYSKHFREQLPQYVMDVLKPINLPVPQYDTSTQLPHHGGL